jgi:AcrR family transcriptional regulator
MTVPSTQPRSRRPRPLLSQRSEEHLGARHREVLDHLEALFLQDGFAGVSVRELAAHVGCSRRTLYELAPSKDDLVLIVLDRFLHRVGRDALDKIDGSATFAQQIAAYFRGGLELQRQTRVFAEDLADEPAARRLFDRHYAYVMEVTEGLVEQGVASGEFRPVSPPIVAGVLAGSGLFFNQADVLADTPADFESIVDALLDIVLVSLTRQPDDRGQTPTVRI